MLTPDMQQRLNDQLNAELYSSYLYLSMAAYFEASDLDGFANWMRVQAREELVHALKFFDFISSRGGRVVLQPVEGPPTDWQSAADAFEEVYRHEQKVTGLINALASSAVAESDHATNTFLQWFVNEQVEEEESANRVLRNLRLIGGDGTGLLMLDRELAQRVFTPPPTAGEAGASA
jgi:ferritin